MPYIWKSNSSTCKLTLCCDVRTAYCKTTASPDDCTCTWLCIPAEYRWWDRRKCCEMLLLCQSHLSLWGDGNAELGYTDISVVESACIYWRTYKRETFLDDGWCLLQVARGPLHEVCLDKSCCGNSETSIQLLCVFRYLLVSDNEQQFTSAEFSKYVIRNDVKHIKTPSYNPPSNGLVERFVNTF